MPSLDDLEAAAGPALWAADRDRRLPARLDQRELSPLRQAQLRVRATGSSRARAALSMDPHGGRPRHQGSAALGRGGGQGARRAGQLPAFAAVTEEIVAVNEAICEARPPNAAARFRPLRPARRPKKGAPRAGRGGVRGGGEPAGRAGRALAGLDRRGHGGSGAGDPHRDDQARGLRCWASCWPPTPGTVARGSTAVRAISAEFVCLPDQDDRHRAGPGRGCGAPTTTAPRAGAGSRRATTSSVSPGCRCRRGCAR